MASEKVILRLDEPLSPTLIMEEGNKDYKCVVMPMRL
jgi:DNA polymerase III sliding clamp (beta) subunit (PCNA family)